jgi:hypothetical protein
VVIVGGTMGGSLEGRGARGGRVMATRVGSTGLAGPGVGATTASSPAEWPTRPAPPAGWAARTVGPPAHARPTGSAGGRSLHSRPPAQLAARGPRSWRPAGFLTDALSHLAEVIDCRGHTAGLRVPRSELAVAADTVGYVYAIGGPYHGPGTLSAVEVDTVPPCSRPTDDLRVLNEW